MSSVINKRHGFYFLHIPKTAGRSVEDMLMKIEGSSVIDVEASEKKRGIFATSVYSEQYFTRPMKARGLRKLFAENIINNSLEDWQKLYKFCIVRNPYERAYSAYKYCMKTADLPNKKQPFGESTPKNLSFSEFLRLPIDFNYEIKNHLYISQTQYMFGFNTQIDFIGKLENINDDLKVLSEKLKISLPSLAHKNSSGTIAEEFIMNNDDKKLIETLFKDDFINFSYKMTSV